MPFAIRDLQPETLSYTFNVDLQSPIEEGNEHRLNAACMACTRSILAGAYGLAPIDPSSSYVEPNDDFVTAYGKTIEWAVLKLRGTDPVSALDWSDEHLRRVPRSMSGHLAAGDRVTGEVRCRRRSDLSPSSLSMRRTQR